MTHILKSTTHWRNSVKSFPIENHKFYIQESGDQEFCQIITRRDKSGLVWTKVSEMEMCEFLFQHIAYTRDTKEVENTPDGFNIYEITGNDL